jgi:hypothetical protein
MTARILRTAAVVAGLAPLALGVLPLPASAQATPTIFWNTYLGGSAADGGFSATDDEPLGIISSKDGETFVAGRTNSPLFPNTPPPLAPTGGFGGYDAFVTKYQVDGGVAWTRVFGGPGDDVAMRLAFIPSTEEHLYVVGTTGSTSASLNGPGQKFGNLQGAKDAFLARLEPDNGTLSWFMYLDGDGGVDEGRDISIFQHVPYRRIYVTGDRSGDVFVTQVDDTSTSTPRAVWSTTFGSPVLDYAYAVATAQVSNENHLVFVGGAVGQSLPTSFMPRPVNNYGGAESDGFVTQLNPADGGINWFRYVGGNGRDDVRDLVSGGPVVVGNTTSRDFPVERDDSNRIFLLRVGGDGSLQDKPLLVGQGGEFMMGHAGADTEGNIFIGGRTTSPALALNAFDSSPNFGGTFKDDGFVAMVHWKLDGLIWASYVGGASDTSEAVTGLVSVPLGTLAFIGSSSADGGVLVANAGHDPSANGGQDGYIFRLKVDPYAELPLDAGSPGSDAGTPGQQDAGTPGQQDAGTPGQQDAGTPGSEDEEVLSPLGWSCGSTGGGGLVGTFALLAVALLLSRRASS